MKSFLFFLFGLVIGIINLTAQNNIAFPQQELRIDPEAATGGSVSQIFEEINYIPLETNRQSLINKIDKILVTKTHYIILDEQSKAVLLFKKNGRFQGRISRFGNVNPKSENYNIDNLLYDFLKDEIIVSTYNYNTKGEDCQLHYFKPDGSYVKSTKTYKNLNFRLNIEAIGNRRFVFFADVPYNEREAQSQTWRGFNTLFFLKSDTIAYKKYLPYEPNKYLQLAGGAVYIGSTRFTNTNGNVLYYKRDNYTLYSVDSGGIRSAYKFIFPASYSFPADFFTDTVKWKDRNLPKNMSSRMDFIQKNNLVIYDLSHFYPMKDYLLFNIVKFKFNAADRGLIYNMKTGSLISLYRVEPDIMNVYLPLNNDVIAADDAFIYSTISSNKLAAQSEEVRKNRKVVFKPELENYFKNRSPNSNPVIIRMRLKPGL